MEVLMWYFLFAVTTSLASMYELFIPVMRTLEVAAPKNNVIQYKYITYFTFFMLSIILAPLLLPSCLIPSFSSRFKEALLKSLS